MRHGEAVAIGMVYAARLAHRMAYCDARVPDRIEALLAAYGLPTGLAALARHPDPNKLLDALQVDKKAEGGKVRFILPKRIGEVVVTREWDERELHELIAR